MKSKLGQFLDNSTIFFISFIVNFVILKSIIISNLIIIILSCFISFFILKILLYFQNKKLRDLSIKNSEKQNIIDCNFALRKLSESSQVTFFKNLLKDKNSLKCPHGLILANKVLLSIQINFDIINPEQIFKIYSKAKNMKKYKIEEICLICNKISDETKNIISNFDIKITIFTPVETFALMKKHCYFPTLSAKPTKIKNNFLKQTFVRNKAKQFIKCSIFLYILSLIVPFTKYYIICASVLMSTGVILLLFCKNKTIIEPLSKQILLN